MPLPGRLEGTSIVSDLGALDGTGIGGVSSSAIYVPPAPIKNESGLGVSTTGGARSTGRQVGDGGSLRGVAVGKEGGDRPRHAIEKVLYITAFTLRWVEGLLETRRTPCEQVSWNPLFRGRGL